MGVYGGIEAGGTKIVCAVGTGPDDIHAEERFATRSMLVTVSWKRWASPPLDRWIPTRPRPPGAM